MGDPVHDALSSVGPRLRNLRKGAGLTLADVSLSTGISASTLSRLESGKRKATLELLVPLARTHRVTLDHLVAGHPPTDPRVRNEPVELDGVTFVSLTDAPGPHKAYKIVLHPARAAREPTPQVHEGHEWLYVLGGRLRLVLGERELVLRAGEAAEFDTQTPHWFGNGDAEQVEFLVLFSVQGERIHVRARPGTPARDVNLDPK